MDETISVIGAGVIGGAIVKSLLKSGRYKRIIATRRRVEKLRELEELGAVTTGDNRWAAREADIVFICVKPGDVGKVLEEIREEIKGKLVVSTAATIPLDFYKSIVPEAKFVRTMPNLCLLVQESFTAYCCSRDVTEDDKKKVRNVLKVLGRCEEVEEKYMDAITALSGSAPAYVSIIIEGLMYAGLKVGLPRDLALESSAQALLGTAKLILETKLSSSQIKDMVTTPGGVTVEGVYQIEDGGVRTALIRAVEAATEKCKKIRKFWSS